MKIHWKIRRVIPLATLLALLSCQASLYVPPILLPSCTLASSWTTVDDYQYDTHHDSVAQRVNATGSELFAAGEGTDSGGVTHWVVRRSADQGKTWSTVDDYQLASGFGVGVRGVIADDTGMALVAGFASDAGGIFHSIVRKSVDAGTSWTVASDFLYVPGYSTTMGGDFAWSGSTLYLNGGEAFDAGGVFHWLTRKSTDNGSTWVTANEYTYNGGTGVGAIGTNTVVHPSGTLFSAGNGDSLQRWLIRASADQGVNWSVLENFSYAAGQWSYPFLIAGDELGGLYAAGQALDASGKSHLLVRRSVDVGASWSTVDDYQLAAGQDALAYSIHAGGGVIASAGYGFDASGMKHGITRMSLDQGATWSTSDVFQLSAAQATRAIGISRDAQGNWYTSLEAKDDAGNSHWMIRKLDCE